MRLKQSRIDYILANKFYQIEKKDILHICKENSIEVKNILPAGSMRRKRKSIGDIDIVIEVNKVEEFKNIMRSLGYKPQLESSFLKRTEHKFNFDIFVAGKYDFYSMLFFLTGSEDWNIKIAKHLRNNTDIIYHPFFFKNKNKEELLRFKSEEDIFELISHSYIEPKNRLPKNINFKIKGI